MQINLNCLWILLLLLLGILMIIKPEILWKLEHFLEIKNGEPTDLYLALMRIGGVFFVFCSVVAFFYLW